MCVCVCVKDRKEKQIKGEGKLAAEGLMQCRLTEVRSTQRGGEARGGGLI